jgi:hypothetical protein
VLWFEAFSQLHDWYLVPASDGTHLGAGLAAATVGLVNITLTSQHPESPFGLAALDVIRRQAVSTSLRDSLAWCT